MRWKLQIPLSIFSTKRQQKFTRLPVTQNVIYKYGYCSCAVTRNQYAAAAVVIHITCNMNSKTTKTNWITNVLFRIQLQLDTKLGRDSQRRSNGPKFKKILRLFQDFYCNSSLLSRNYQSNTAINFHLPWLKRFICAVIDNSKHRENILKTSNEVILPFCWNTIRTYSMFT